MSLAELVNPLMISGLVAMMLTMGMRVTLAELGASLGRLRLLAAIVAGNYLVVPLAVTGLIEVVQFPPLVATGLLTLAVCPGAPIAPPFVALARGDMPLAIGLMIVLAGTSAVASPLLLVGLLGLTGGGEPLRIDPVALLKTLLIAQLLPLAMGLALRQCVPALARRLVDHLGSLANLLLHAALILATIHAFPFLVTISVTAWMGMGLLFLVSAGVGRVCGGRQNSSRKSAILTTEIRNVAVALLIVSANFPGTTAVTTVIAYALLSVAGGLLTAFTLREQDSASGTDDVARSAG